jgi:hypothetical protein
MKIPKVKIERAAPSLMAEDLGKKFMDDLQKLIMRSISIMGPSLGATSAAEIILTSLSIAGAHVEVMANFQKGTFMAYAKLSMEEARKST